MAPRKGFLELVKPVGVKGDASAIDDTQSSMLESLASGDISGSLSSGDKLIALGALLKSVSRGSKTTPQEVMQNLQASKLQEMQNKIQLQQLRAERERKARLKPIVERAAGIGPAGASGQPLMPEDLFALSAQALAEGDPELAKALREQAAGIAQYTGAGVMTTAFAGSAGKAAFDMIKGTRPDGTPFELPRFRAEGYPTAAAWVAAQTPSGGGAPAPASSGAPTIPTQVDGRTVNVPVMSSPVEGIGVTGLSEGDKATIAARGEQFKNLLVDAQSTAMAAQQRLPQVQAMGALSEALATGKTAEWRNAAQSWLNAFGLSDNPEAKAAVANASAFADLRKRNTLTMLQSQKGASSDKDMQFAASVGPLMTNTPAGNRLITATESALLRRDINFNNFLGRYNGPPGQALEAWGKTRQGRLGVLGDPEYVRAAVATGALKLGEGVDKRTNKKVYFVQTKNGNRIFLN